MAEKTRRIAVVMAGGGGERFWPLSTRGRPKQLLRLADPRRTMLEQAIARLTPLIAPEQVFIATGRHLREAMRTSQTLVPADNILAEPCKRNTLGCLCYAAAEMLARYGAEAGDLTMAVVTADHRIENDEGFRDAVATAMSTAETEEALVTVGIPPARAETGYGYLELPGDWRQDRDGGRRAVPVRRFVEKPDMATAQSFCQAGNYLWNSGMFFWRLEVFLAELARWQPQAAGIVRDLSEALVAGNLRDLERRFAELPDLSVDYALMERTDRAMAVVGDFSWDDVGSWDSLQRSFPPDAQGNVAVGDPLLLETEDSIVCQYGDAGRELVTLGVRGLVVVATDNGILVTTRERAQEVKGVVAELRRRGSASV